MHTPSDFTSDHFQPVMWKMYAQQLEGWESAVQKIQGSSNGYQQRRLPPKPAMFAFCLKPRGRQLQIPSKGSKGPKQRSHKKLMYSGSHSFSREQDGFHRPGTSLMFCSQIIGSCFPPRPPCLVIRFPVSVKSIRPEIW